MWGNTNFYTKLLISIFILFWINIHYGIGQKFTRGTISSSITIKNLEKNETAKNYADQNVDFKFETITYFDETKMCIWSEDMTMDESAIRMVLHKDSLNYYTFYVDTITETYEINPMDEFFEDVEDEDVEIDSITDHEPYLGLTCKKIYYSKPRGRGWKVITHELPDFETNVLGQEAMDPYILEEEFFDTVSYLHSKLETLSFIPEILDTSVFSFNIDGKISMSDYLKNLELENQSPLHNAPTHESELIRNLIQDKLLLSSHIENVSKKDIPIDTAGLIRGITVTLADNNKKFSPEVLKSILIKHHLLQPTIEAVLNMDCYQSADLFEELMLSIYLAAYKEYFLQDFAKNNFYDNTVSAGYIKHNIDNKHKFLEGELDYSDIIAEFKNIKTLKEINITSNEDILQSMFELYKLTLSHEFPEMGLIKNDSSIIIKINQREYVITISSILKKKDDYCDIDNDSANNSGLLISENYYKNMVQYVHQILIDHDKQAQYNITTCWELLNDPYPCISYLQYKHPILQPSKNKIFLIKNEIDTKHSPIIFSKSGFPENNIYLYKRIQLPEYRNSVAYGISLTSQNKDRFISFLQEYATEFKISDVEIYEIKGFLNSNYFKNRDYLFNNIKIKNLGFFTYEWELFQFGISELNDKKPHTLQDFFPKLYSYFQDNTLLKDFYFDMLTYTLHFTYQGKDIKLENFETTIFNFFNKNNITGKDEKRFYQVKDLGNIILYLRPQEYKDFLKIFELDVPK